MGKKATSKRARTVVQVDTAEHIVIPPMREEIIEIDIVGTAPYVSNKFSEKAKRQMRDVQEAGSTAKTKKKKEPKDFNEMFRGSQHVSSEGWVGMPASAFRAACISACRLVGFKMTIAKLSIFIIADGLDATEGTPLVRIEGEPEHVEHCVRVANGAPDIHARAMWRDWKATLRVRYDADQFTRADVCNLIHRVGMQVGIGEGRPDSKASAGMGWGTFTLQSMLDSAQAAE